MEAHAGPNGVGENRREHRRRVLKCARIIFNGGYSVFDCRVRNISEGGAMLEMPSLVGIPAHFEIALESTGARRPCTVVWRTNTLMGVAFDDTNRQAAQT